MYEYNSCTYMVWFSNVKHAGGSNVKYVQLRYKYNCTIIQILYVLVCTKLKYVLYVQLRYKYNRTVHSTAIHVHVVCTIQYSKR